MANRERGEVSLSVGGETYTLVLNTNAMAAIEEAADATWDEFWPGVMKGRVRSIRLLLWGMAQKYHPKLTVSNVGDLIDGAGGLPGLVSIMTSAHEASSPEASDERELTPANPQKAQARKRARHGGGSI
jgi:hypothetical protein